MSLPHCYQSAKQRAFMIHRPSCSGARSWPVLGAEWPALSEEAIVGFELGADIEQRVVALEIYLLVFDRAPQLTDEDAVDAAPRSSIDRLMTQSRKVYVNSAEVNWQPRSVFTISCVPCRWSARYSARTQNAASQVFDISQLSRARLCQSRTALR